MSRDVLCGLLAAALAMSPTGSLRAGNITTDRAIAMEFVDRAEVAAELERAGVSREQAQARIAAMSDEEIASLSGQIQSLPAGGGCDPWCELVVQVLVGAIVVGLIVLGIYYFAKSAHQRRIFRRENPCPDERLLIEDRMRDCPGYVITLIEPDCGRWIDPASNMQWLPASQAEAHEKKLREACESSTPK